MGTTLIAILRSGNKLVLAHIGDSRAFLARDGKLTQITKDHSFVQTLVDEGRITEDEADRPPAALAGHPGPHRAATTTSPTSRCARPASATATSSLRRPHRLRRRRHHRRDRLGRASPPAATADRLVELALKAGAPDNVTIVIGDVVDLDKAPRPSTAAPDRRRRRARAKGTRPDPGHPGRQGRRALPRGHRRRATTTRSPSPRRAPLGPRTLAAPRRRGPGLLAASSSAAARMPRTPGPAPVLRGRARRQCRHLPGRLAGPRADQPVPRRARSDDRRGRPARLLPRPRSRTPSRPTPSRTPRPSSSSLRIEASAAPSARRPAAPAARAARPAPRPRADHRHPDHDARPPDHGATTPPTTGTHMTTVSSLPPRTRRNVELVAAAARRRHRRAGLRQRRASRPRAASRPG